MATNEQNDDRLRPTLTADRYKVETGLEPGLPSSGEWQWIGGGEDNEASLARLGVAAGQAVEEDTYNKALNGFDAAGGVVRNETTLPRDKPETGYMRGQTQVKGSLTAPAEMASLWQTGNPAQKEVLRTALLKETAEAIKLLTRAEDIAAPANVTAVGQGSDVSLKVEWVAVGADRGKGLATPFDKNAITKVNNDELLRESAERLGTALAKAREVEIATPAAAAPEVEAPAARPASPELPPSKPLDLLQEPLADSIGDALAAKKISREAANNIWKLGLTAARSNDLGSLSKQELRAGLPEKNPFAQFPDGPSDPELREQWQRDVVRTAAIEGQLIENRSRDFENLARDESKRQEKPRPHPMKKIRTVRKDADVIDRKAAILAHEVGSISPQERQARIEELGLQLKEQGGLKSADREHLAEFVALRHCGNIDTADAAERAAERAAAIPEPERSTPGIGRDPFG